MRALIQRVSHASVTVEGDCLSRIGPGLLILLGVGPEDNAATADFLAEKIANLRIFEDEAGKMNRSLLDCKGEALVVSQFTLYADCRKGRRPAFVGAAGPQLAEELYEYFADTLAQKDIGAVGRGRFGADMKVELLNDGPVTIWLDTEQLLPKK